MLRQRTLFEYGLPTMGPNHERGLPKERAEFANPIQHSMPWGDNIVSGQQVTQNGIFRLVSHNVNGLLPANNHIDVIDMAKAMDEKEVAIFATKFRATEYGRLISPGYPRNEHASSRCRFLSQIAMTPGLSAGRHGDFCLKQVGDQVFIQRPRCLWTMVMDDSRGSRD